MYKIILVIFIWISFLFSESIISHHDISMNINPSTNELATEDTFIITTDDNFEFYLSDKLTIHSIKIGGNQREYDLQFDENIGFNRIIIRRKLLESKTVEISVSYSGVMVQDTESSTFSREKIAMEIEATISEKGVFLSPSSGYYPRADENLLTFHTQIYLPEYWSAVSEGKLIHQGKANSLLDISLSEFETQHKVDGIFVTAAEWVINKKVVNDVEFYTYFFPEDSSLALNYLNKSIEYVEMYSEMISSYPFPKFAVVENFFPTGYGMPSYTVLGRSVIHLPFIVYTSLGHEVLHNWWGNSVYVGDGGNWCEGLTSYQADYLYKLQKSSKDAKQYRKNLLKDYTVYATEKKDFAPKDFVSRTDMSSRSIGYGKVAMIFHMIEEYLGNEKFMEALKLVVKNQQWKETSYEHFFVAFEEVSGKDLSEFKQKWINEKGNPKLELVKEKNEFYIKQTSAVKPMWINVTIQTGETTRIDKIFSNSELTKIPNIKNSVTTVIVDDDYHIMRTLDESEMDMTIRHLLGESKFGFVIPEKTDEWVNLAQLFNGHIDADNKLSLFILTDKILEIPMVYLGVIPEKLKYLKSNGSMEIYKQSMTSDDHSLVWAFKQDNEQSGLLVYSSNQRELIPLARKIPHYGKYGYLIFENGKNITKGNHEVIESPLIWKK